MSNRLLFPSLLLALAACGGGGGSTGDIQGLQGPSQVSLIDTNDGSSGSLRLPAGVRGVAGSDYTTDQTNLWVRDDSMAALDTVNMILSYLEQTHYWEQTNAGAYRALVEASDRGGGDRGNNGPSYEEWVVESTRESNDAPQVVKFWISSVDSGQPQTIYGKLIVTAAPTDADPLGQFTLNFKQLLVGQAPESTDTNFEGYLRTVSRTDGQTEVEFFNGHGDPAGSVAIGERAMRERAHVIANKAAGTGRAYAEQSYKENQGGSIYTSSGEYQLQFNADYVARRDVANGNTLSVLDRNDYSTRIYQYGLYDATTEAKVTQMSGFPVQDAAGNNGWAGYHGIWFPGNVTLTNGQTLYRRAFGSNTSTPYTLVIVDGKLLKRTRSSITVADIVNEDMEYFSPSAGGELKVRFTSSDIVKFAQRVSGEWQTIDPPISIASSFTTGQFLNFWSQARGSVEMIWPATLATSTSAFVWEATTITSDSPELASGDLTLEGYFHMLRANITSNQANFQSGESPYLPSATSVSSGNQTYVFDKETLMLTLGGDPVNFGSGVSVSQGPGQFGLDCGPLFPGALSSFGDIATQSVTYNWTIGSNSWNRLQALQDSSSAYVQFDPPIRFTYVHDETGSPYDGRTFFLQWDGTNLGGIPWEQGEDGRNYPRFNIPTGTTLTSGSTTYKIKQLEGEQLMVEVGSPSTVYTAQGFDLDGQTITAPTGSPYEDPAIGAKPTVTAAPLYVGGVSQASGDGN